MSTSNQLTQFWIEFIELYKSLPQLWKVSHEGYSHKHSRNSAYKMMLEKYQEFDEGANMDHVKKKIANMRTSFRRESKKVDEDNTYEPILWYYPHMEFIRDQEDDHNDDGLDDNEKYSKKKIKKEDVELNRLSLAKKRKMNGTSPNPSNRQSLTPSVNATKSDKHRFSHIDITPVMMPTTSPPSTPPPPASTRHHYKTQDEARTLSATWEVLFRKLDPQQKLFANRIITEVLYLGALKKLKSNSHKLFEHLSGQSARRHQENPINVIYNNGRSQERVSNTREALRKLKQVENFALRENHEAIDLIMQLEDLLKNSVENHSNEVADEDTKDYDDEVEDVDEYDF